jgi:SAM-dependent methyltransferase
MSEEPRARLSPHDQVRKMMRGFEQSQLIYVAVKLGIADLLQDGSGDAQTLGIRAGIEPSLMYRVMRGLAWCGLVRHAEDDSFSLTRLGRCLRSDADDSLCDHVRCVGEIEWPAWSALLHAVRTPDTAFEHAFGAKFYDYLAQNAEAGAYFDRMMGVSTAPVARAVVEAYDFSSVETIADIGAGNGTLVTAILRANTHLRGILFDLPSVIARTAEQLEGSDVAGRLQAVGGNFFTEVPAGADTYLMRWVLHNWSDDQCARVLENCHRAMRPSGRLLVLEQVMPPRVDPSTETVSLDLGMLVHLGGCERTEDEFRQLLRRGGFQWTRTIPTAVSTQILEAIPV